MEEKIRYLSSLGKIQSKNHKFVLMSPSMTFATPMLVFPMRQMGHTVQLQCRQLVELVFSTLRVRLCQTLESVWVV